MIEMTGTDVTGKSREEVAGEGGLGGREEKGGGKKEERKKERENKNKMHTQGKDEGRPCEKSFLLIVQNNG